MEHLSQFQTKEVYQDVNNIYRALLSYEEDLLRVEVRSDVSVEEASQYIKTQLTRMNGIFEKARSPYPGDVSNEIVCGEEWKPEFGKETNKGVEISFSLGFLNDRLTYGACTQDSAVYRVLTMWFFCANQRNVYTMELIVPKEEYIQKPDIVARTLLSIVCL